MSGIYRRKTEGMVAKMAKRIVFWGDSITDAGRDRSAETDKSGYNRYLGCGYAQLIQAALGYDFPDEYEVLNRGISGNRIVDLYARIKADLINLKPDVISILIGINDVWHEYAHQNGVDAEKFELIYDWIVQEIRESLPDAKILILEPFVLPGSATVSTEEAPNRWEFFFTETRLRQIASRKIAEKYNLVYIPLQEEFDRLDAETKTEGYWLGDGVHPMGAGHEMIKRKWLKAFLNV